MKLVRTDAFKKDYKKLPQPVQEKVKKQLRLLLENPEHPSLHVKKMRGYSDIWEGRITYHYRFTFNIDSENYILRRIGP